MVFCAILGPWLVTSDHWDKLVLCADEQQGGNTCWTKTCDGIGDDHGRRRHRSLRSGIAAV